MLISILSNLWTWGKKLSSPQPNAIFTQSKQHVAFIVYKGVDVELTLPVENYNSIDSVKRYTYNTYSDYIQSLSVGRNSYKNVWGSIDSNYVSFSSISDVGKIITNTYRDISENIYIEYISFNKYQLCKSFEYITHTFVDSTLDVGYTQYFDDCISINSNFINYSPISYVKTVLLKLRDKRKLLKMAGLLVVDDELFFKCYDSFKYY